MGLVSLRSNLAINGTPERYDAQGKLGDLPPGASQLDFDGALPASADNFTNVNANGFTIQNPIGVTQFINDGQTSQFGFPGAVPPGVDYFVNTYSKGFIIKAPVGVTQFVGVNGSTYNNPNGTNINTTPGLGVDFFTNIYAKGFTIKNSWGDSQFNGINGTQFINPSGKNLINSTPEDFGVDYLSNEPQKNFIIKQPKNKSNFTGISDDGYGTTYSFVTPLNRLRVTNWFPNETAGATGFKDRIAPYESGFIGISADSTKYQYPDTVAGARLLNVRLGQGAGTAKLENQLGNGSKMGNTGFYAENRYGEAVRNADNQSLLASWALRRRSPSPLEQQYAKFKLRDEAFNPTFIGHPLILRGLQNPDVLGPQRWGIDALGQQEGRTAANNLAAALDGGFIRGGASTALERSAIDTARIAKFLASPRGIVWIATQVGLGKSNPLVEKNPLFAIPLNDTRTHTGLASLLSIPGTAFGLHITRHGIPFANEVASYERVMRDKILSAGTSMSEVVLKNPAATGPQASDRFNRLLQLKKELFGVGIGDPPKNSSLGFFQKLSTLFRAPVSVTPGSLGVRGGDTPIIQTLSGLGGPGAVYGIGSTTIRRYVDTVNFPDEESRRLISRAGTSGQLYNPFQKYYTGHAGNSSNDTDTGVGIESDRKSDLQLLLDNKLDNAAINNIDYNPGTFNAVDDDLGRVSYSAKPVGTDGTNKSGIKHSSLPYNEIRAIADRRRNAIGTEINDFRTSLTGDTKTFSGNPDIANYAEKNIRDRYGFGDQGKVNADRSDPYVSFNNNGQPIKNIDDTILNLKKDGKFSLANNPNFRGDRINAIDYIPESKAVTKEDVYPTGVRDFIKFYFSGIDLFDCSTDDAIVFRSTIKGLSDSFSPSWNTVSIMGRPDGPAIYSSFERNISFQFMAAATSREELVPMWRKLNYLASYTMPIYGAGRPGGALCRITLGDMFVNTPGYFTGVTYTVNDEASWDLADDLATDTTISSGVTNKNSYAKQLPNVVDVDIQFKIIHDWRPQKGGRVYSLYDGNFTPAKNNGSWLWDSNI